MEVKRDILWRVYLSFIGIVVISFFVLGRVVYIQNFQGNYWKSMSDSLHQRIEEIDARRGTIYSEDKQMLSTSLPTFAIYFDFMADGLREKNGKRFKENIDSFSISLANHFKDKDVITYKKELQQAYKNGDRYYLLKRKLEFQDFKILREFPLAKLGRNKSGMIVEENSKRLMPFGLLANRTIGLSREYLINKRKIKKQNVGLEKSYDSLLTGQKGQRLVRFIAGGVAVPIDGYQIEPENGKDVITTLDVNMQDLASTALMRMMLESESQYGTAIVMETKTGKIKAIANLGRQTDGTYWEDNNYALQVSEPGSTIKLATLLAVLEENKSSINEMVDVGTAGKMTVGPRIVNDAERSPKPILSLKECFAHSSNVGMSKLAYKNFGANPEKFKSYLHQYYLDVKSPIDLSDVAKPQLAPFEKNRGGIMNMITVSFGYAIQVSPLQTLSLYNAIANNGKMMKPYLVNKIEREGIVQKEFNPTTLVENIGSASTIKYAKESMEAVATEGTGKYVFKDMPFAVAGKTGTAHVADGKVKYEDGVYLASFVGYFPANDPQFSCIVVIRSKPHAALHYGGQLAAPVFKEIATKLYATYVDKKKINIVNFKKDSSKYYYAGYTSEIKNVFNTLQMSFVDSSMQMKWCNVFPANYNPVIKNKIMAATYMPNLKGLGLKDALFLLENLGLKVKSNGVGKVVEQSIAAGNNFSKGSVVYLVLG